MVYKSRIKLVHIKYDKFDIIILLSSKRQMSLDYADYKEMAQWITFNDLDPAKHETTIASQAMDRCDFKVSGKAYRSVFSVARARNKSELFTPYEMILLELILYSEVSCH